MQGLSHGSPLFALGMTSLVLGVVGLILSLLPVMGIPISACALCLGILGCVASLVSRGASLRWSLAGVAISLLALGAALALNWAPSIELPGYKVPRPWQSVPDRPYAPPPARQG